MLLAAGFPIWRLEFDPATNEISTAQIRRLREALVPYREILLRSGRGAVELVGVASRAGDPKTATQVRVARALIISQGIPAERVRYAARVAESHEPTGIIEVHVRDIE